MSTKSCDNLPRFIDGITNGAKWYPVFGKYRTNPKNPDTRKIAVIILKLQQYRFYYRAMCPEGADEIANSVDPDLTDPVGRSV